MTNLECGVYTPIGIGRDHPASPLRYRPALIAIATTLALGMELISIFRPHQIYRAGRISAPRRSSLISIKAGAEPHPKLKMILRLRPTAALHVRGMRGVHTRIANAFWSFAGRVRR